MKKEVKDPDREAFYKSSVSKWILLDIESINRSENDI